MNALVGSSHWLLAVDADTIQSYVYESSRLPEIRGASQLLQDLQQEMRETVQGCGGVLCFCAGGSLLAYFDNMERAEACGRAIARRFVERTMIATATWAIVPCRVDPREDTNREPFQQAREAAAQELRRKKLSRSDLPFFEAPPYAQRCASCDVRPAAELVQWAPEEEPRPICEPCRRKLEYGRKRLAEETRASAVPRTFAEINNRRAVAMILLDGDGMGEALKDKSWRELQRFSQRLDGAVKESVRQALDALNLKERCQRIYEGGDDLLLFAPGEYGLALALEIMRLFHEKMKKQATLSGGVVIFPPHYPVYFLHRLAKALARSAKQARRRAQLLGAPEGQEGWLDFEILRSASAEASELTALRAGRESVSESAAMIVRQYDRPYSQSRMTQLVAVAQKMREKKLKGQITMIAAAQRLGPLPGAAFFLYQQAREEELEAALSGVSAGTPGVGAAACLRKEYNDPPGWRSQQKNGIRIYSTCLPDLADLYDYVVAKEEPSHANAGD